MSYLLMSNSKSLSFSAEIVTMTVSLCGFFNSGVFSFVMLSFASLPFFSKFTMKNSLHVTLDSAVLCRFANSQNTSLDDFALVEFYHYHLSLAF